MTDLQVLLVLAIIAPVGFVLAVWLLVRVLIDAVFWARERNTARALNRK